MTDAAEPGQPTLLQRYEAALAAMGESTGKGVPPRAIGLAMGASPTAVSRLKRVVAEAPKKLVEAVRRGDVGYISAYTALVRLDGNELIRVVAEASGADLRERLRVAVKLAPPKKKPRQGPKIQQTSRPFQDVERVELALGRLQQYWMLSTPEVRSTFMVWVTMNMAKYPIHKGQSDGI